MTLNRNIHGVCNEPKRYIYIYIFPINTQVLIREGRTWLDQRRFTLVTLRDFGFGKSSMEEMINEEVGLFMEEIQKSERKPLDFINTFNLPILNALWRVTVGQRFDYDDRRLISIIHKLTDPLKQAADPSAILIILLPSWVTKHYPKLIRQDETLAVNHDIMSMMKQTIAKHKESHSRICQQP